MPTTAADHPAPGLPTVLVSAVVLVDADGRVLLAQRPEGKSMAGLWEFPGGKVEAGETPEAQFAKAADRIMPVLQNLEQQGGSWVEHGISRAQVLAKVECIATVCPDLWRDLESRLRNATFWDEAGKVV